MTHQIAFPPPSTVPELALAKEVRAMFLGNEQGAWYDPSDMSTLFQDAAGTTPVTSVEQPVGLVLDKSKGLVRGVEIWADASTSFFGESSKVSPGVYRIYSSAGVNSGVIIPAVLVAGRRYEATFTINSIAVPGFISIAGSPDVSFNTVGVKRCIFVALNANAVFKRNNVCDFQISEVSFKELPGNHAFQTTAASRPVLSARVNLLTKTEQFDDAVWVKQQAITIITDSDIAPNGTQTADTLVNGGLASSGVRQSATLLAGVNYEYRLYLKAGTSSVGVLGVNAGGWLPSSIKILSGPGSVSGSGLSFVSGLSGSEWTHVEMLVTGTGSVGSVYVYPDTINAGSTKTLTVWGADLRVANTGVNLPPYQRVNTATDYDTAGFPHYLRFDGVDDFLQTNAINFTSTDKMTVWAGVRKLSDAAASALVELSANSGSGRAFAVFAPSGAGGADFSWRSAGTSPAFVSSFGRPSPITGVLSCLGDIAGDAAILRINGTQAASSAADQGTGTYGNYPLYIGRRAGTSLPFNGHLYQLIVRGAQSSLPQVQAGEKWTNNRTGAY